MCSIGKHPNSYSFSRKALPGFLAYCVRNLVFLGSTFPTETCWRHQEPLAMGIYGHFCFAVTGVASSSWPVGPAWAGAQEPGTRQLSLSPRCINCSPFLIGSSARPRTRFDVKDLNVDVKFPIFRYFCLVWVCLALKLGSAPLLPFFAAVVQVLLLEEGLFQRTCMTRSIWPYQAVPDQLRWAGGPLCLGHCTSPLLTITFLYFTYYIIKYHTCERCVTDYCPGRWRTWLT